MLPAVHLSHKPAGWKRRSFFQPPFVPAGRLEKQRTTLVENDPQHGE
jgi:hypothetical protein